MVAKEPVIKGIDSARWPKSASKITGTLYFFIIGTAKSKKKSIYGEQDTTPTTIDGDSLKDLLKELGANVKPGYIGTTGPRPIVNVNKTDTDSRKDKYRNQ